MLRTVRYPGSDASTDAPATALCSRRRGVRQSIVESTDAFLVEPPGRVALLSVVLDAYGMPRLCLLSAPAFDRSVLRRLRSWRSLFADSSRERPPLSNRSLPSFRLLRTLLISVAGTARRTFLATHDSREREK